LSNASVLKETSIKVIYFLSEKDSPPPKLTLKILKNLYPPDSLKMTSYEWILTRYINESMSPEIMMSVIEIVLQFYM